MTFQAKRACLLPNRMAYKGEEVVQKKKRTGQHRSMSKGGETSFHPVWLLLHGTEVKQELGGKGNC